MEEKRPYESTPGGMFTLRDGGRIYLDPSEISSIESDEEHGSRVTMCGGASHRVTQSPIYVALVKRQSSVGSDDLPNMLRR